MVWWAIWGIRNANWDFVAFFAQLGTPVLLYLQASSLVTSSPDSIVDWRGHFYEVRRRFFGLNILFALALLAAPALAIGRLPPLSVYLVAATIIVLSIFGFRSTSHRVQGVVALVAALLNLVTIVSLMLAPLQMGPAV
jgi:hypothetical protein